MQTKSEMINRIAELAKENAELKAENEKLKALCDTYKTCYQAKHSDIKCLFIKYKQTLQEIKAIAEVGQDKYHNGLIIAKPIIDLINKAESEG